MSIQEVTSNPPQRQFHLANTLSTTQMADRRAGSQRRPRAAAAAVEAVDDATAAAAHDDDEGIDSDITLDTQQKGNTLIWVVAAAMYRYVTMGNASTSIISQFAGKLMLQDLIRFQMAEILVRYMGCTLRQSRG
jgi:hypothetical protein